MHSRLQPCASRLQPECQPELAWQIYEWADGEGLLRGGEARAKALDLAIAAVLPMAAGGGGRGGVGEGWEGLVLLERIRGTICLCLSW